MNQAFVFVIDGIINDTEASNSDAVVLFFHNIHDCLVHDVTVCLVHDLFVSFSDGGNVGTNHFNV